MKILIIEDDKFTSKLYESEFHQENIEVELAADGEEGIKKARKTKPDLILLDLILPKINGFEVLEILKNEKKLKNIPVVILSALSQQVDIDEAMKLGAVKYLSKEDYSHKQITQEVLNVLMKL